MRTIITEKVETLDLKIRYILYGYFWIKEVILIHHYEKILPEVSNAKMTSQSDILVRRLLFMNGAIINGNEVEDLGETLPIVKCGLRTTRRGMMLNKSLSDDQKQ